MEQKQHSQKGCSEFHNFKEDYCVVQARNSSSRNKIGAVEFWRLKAESTSSFQQSPHWSVQLWLNHLESGGAHKKNSSFVLTGEDNSVIYLRAIQGHSGENYVDPSWFDTVLIPDCFFEFHSSHRKLFQLALLFKQN